MSALTTLLEITLYSTVLFMAILLFRVLLKRHASPVLMYAIWFLLIARLLVPVTIDAGFHVFAQPVSQATDVSVMPDGLNNDSVLDQNDTSALNQEYLNNQTPSEDATIQAADGALESAKAQIQAVASKTPLSWETRLMMLWLSGVGVMLTLTGISSIRLKRRILRGSENVPPKWREAVQQISGELHIRRKLRLAVVSGFPTPALSAGLRPVVVLPKEMEDEEAVRFALRHELTHLKRSDHIFCLLWLMLRAVYWFNPVVWIAVKLMRLDMETACDSMVTMRMSAGGRARYAQAVLAMHTQPQVRYALGMALGSTKKTVERRIRGIFMRNQTGHSIRFAAALLALVMALACFTTACQPAKPVVVNKADGTLAEISRTAEPQKKYEAPARWSETVEGEKLNIVFDNDIKLPDTSAYPVIKVEPVAFSQQQIDKLVRYFVGDKKLFLPHIRTKEEYDDEIADAKRGIVCGEFQGIEDSESWVQELEKMRDAAPDESPIIYTDTTLTYRKDEYGKDITENGKNYLSACFENADGSGGSIYASNEFEGYWQTTYLGFANNLGTNYMTESMYQNLIVESGETEEQTGWTGASELFDTFAVDEEAALEKAVQVLDDLDIKEMMLASTEKAVAPGAPEKSCYVLVFARQSSGIPVYWFGGGGYSKDEDPPAYSPPISEETIRVWVSKDGIEGFAWHGQSRVVETVSQNVALLPFEDIQKAIIDRISYRKSFYTRGYMSEIAEVRVTSVELRMAYIGIKDNANQALIVPAWVVESIFSYDNGSNSETYHDEPYVINAIDGGVIGLPSF